MNTKKMVSVMLAAALCLQPCLEGQAKKGAKAALQTKKITLKTGQTKKIGIKNKKKKAKYTFQSSKKSIAKVSKAGKIKALKAGTAKVTVKEKLGKKKRKVGVVVIRVKKKVSKAKAVSTPVVTSPAISTETPAATSTATPTAAPTATPTATPTSTPTPKPTATVPPEYNPPSDYTAKKTDVDYGTKEKISYDSKTTDTTRNAYVVLPAGYTEEKTYPVVYLLHGIGGDENEWFSGKPMEIAGNLTANGEADEMILVFPNVRARENDQACYELTVEHFQAFDNFINDLRDDLMPYIESHYSVKTGRENTAVCGLSMGGREALNIGLKMPETFGYIGAFEPAVGVLPYYLESGLFTEDTLTLPEEYKNNTFLMIVKGQNDGTVGENPLLYHKALEKNGVPHIYYDMPGGHDFKVWNNGWYNFAKRIFSKSTITY